MILVLNAKKRIYCILVKKIINVVIFKYVNDSFGN